MKIYSWNMLFRNPELDRAFDFIASTDFDIFCLQEVPEAFLRRLETLPFHVAYQKDVERILPQGVHHIYVVVLSRYPILRNVPIPFPTYHDEVSWRTRLFVWLMPSRFFSSSFRNRNGMYVDLQVGDETLRVFNLHFILGQPKWRYSEFQTAMQHHITPSTVVCGDFNILEKHHIILLNWIFGGSITDALLRKRERHSIETAFTKHAFHNVLRGNMTHTLSRSQLDHILVSNTATIKNAKVIKNRYSSDHHPVFVEVM